MAKKKKFMPIFLKKNIRIYSPYCYNHIFHSTKIFQKFRFESSIKPNSKPHISSSWQYKKAKYRANNKLVKFYPISKPFGRCQAFY